MQNSTLHYDFLIIGGGIFGCYAALYLAKKGAKICLVERESRLFRKASLVNQARLHSGYHYPRSIATAAMSDSHKARFTEEHRDFVLFAFEKYYAVDRFGSFTDARQFERFCNYLKIRCEPVAEHPLFNYDRLEGLYRTEEYTFDPVLLADFYSKKVEAEPNIDLLKNTFPNQAETEGDERRVSLFSSENNSEQSIKTPTVINATYSAINGINRLFGVPDLELMHEISEIAFVMAPSLKNMGLTVMDGPFGSLMPYGKSGLLSLSSVAYTHHKVSYDNQPHFDCQSHAPKGLCTPENPHICFECPARPESAAPKMIGQMSRYFHPDVQMQHWMSYFTIKTKLKSSYIDDARPTEISLLQEKPNFYCLFAGKINSIYEVEKVV